MKRAIVCGGAGFVGSAVIKELLANGVETTVIVRPGFNERKNVHNRLEGLNVEIWECDLSEISKVKEFANNRIYDVWYQFAWDGLFGEDLTNYKKQIMNIQWVMDSLNVAALLGCKKFIGSGSISQDELLVEESSSNNDKHRVYKAAKQTCQYMGNSVGQELGIDFIWPIITNIYGAGESSPRLINSMIRNLQAGKHQSLSEGNQYYDFIYITDAAKAFYLIGKFGRSGRRYVIASGNAQPLKNFLIKLRDVVSPNAHLGFGENEFNGVYLSKELYSIEQLQQDTGFKPEVSFEKGIMLTSDWIKRNQNSGE